MKENIEDVCRELKSTEGDPAKGMLAKLMATHATVIEIQKDFQVSCKEGLKTAASPNGFLLV